VGSVVFDFDTEKELSPREAEELFKEAVREIDHRPLYAYTTPSGGLHIVFDLYEKGWREDLKERLSEMVREIGGEESRIETLYFLFVHLPGLHPRVNVIYTCEATLEGEG